MQLDVCGFAGARIALCDIAAQDLQFAKEMRM
jgi:hypothetical protein